MNNPTDVPACGKFRPASLQDFSTAAKSLQWLLAIPLRRSQELLSRIYGYAGLHELKAVMATPNAAGLFDDQAPAREDWEQRKEREQKAQARGDRAVLLARTECAVLAHDFRLSERVDLVRYLGLFCSPKIQKESFRHAKEALQLVKEAGCSATAAYQFVREFSKPFEYDDSGFDEAGVDWSPLTYLSQLKQFRLPDMILRFPARAVLAADEAGLAFPELQMEFPTSMEDAPSIAESWAEFIFNGNEPCDKYPDEAYEEAAMFLDKPDATTAQTNPILARIENVEMLAQAWPYLQARSVAATVLEYRTHLTVLYQGVAGDEGRPSIDCFMLLVKNDECRDISRDSMAIWKYQITFCELKTDKCLAPLAVAEGYVVVPFGEESRPSAGLFFECMDAHSAMLNDVWKVLQYEFFEPKGYGDLSGFRKSRPFNSFVVVSNIIVRETWRGKGLLPVLMEGICDTLLEYPFSSYDLNWSDIRASPVIEIDGEEQDDDGYEFGTPSVFVFLVAGSRRTNMANFTMRTSPAKVSQGQSVDAEAERRKAKLTPHFQALQGTFSFHDEMAWQEVDPDVLVYDPYEYPNT